MKWIFIFIMICSSYSLLCLYFSRQRLTLVRLKLNWKLLKKDFFQNPFQVKTTSSMVVASVYCINISIILLSESLNKRILYYFRFIFKHLSLLCQVISWLTTLTFNSQVWINFFSKNNQRFFFQKIYSQCSPPEKHLKNPIKF